MSSSETWPVLEEMGSQKLPEVAELLTVLIICNYPLGAELPIASLLGPHKV